MIKKIMPACVALLLLIGYSSCRVIDNVCPYELTSDIKAPDSEIVRLDKYITDNSITATKHSSGLYYKITADGTGNAPTQCNNVGVSYAGSLTNGTVFETNNTNIYFPLSSLIYGWRIGIPLVKRGGKIRLYLPPAFGYGQTAQGSIPKNSILIFDITLNDFN